jgi:hypothetical protein
MVTKTYIWPRTSDSTAVASASITTTFKNELVEYARTQTPCLDSEGQHEETEEALEDIEDVYYEEPNLSGGVEGVDYIIAYGISKSHEEESDN